MERTERGRNRRKGVWGGGEKGEREREIRATLLDSEELLYCGVM